MGASIFNQENSWNNLMELLPGGVNSPIRSGVSLGVRPPIIAYGEQDLIVDQDGKKYIDFCLSWGALLHGHAHPAVVAEATRAICQGSTYGASTLYELALAERIREALPSMEQMRFVSTGTEATMAVVRLARAFTGKDTVIKIRGGYHGHADQFLVQGGSGLITPSSAGVPVSFVQHTHSVSFNDIVSVQQILEKESVAAVILEPICANMGVVVPKKGFLEEVRWLCTRYDAVLIFDEVVTGFRVGFSGAQGYFGVIPDLTCLGKIIGGGFPAAAFGGRKDLMAQLAPAGQVYQAGTFSGNPLSMRAGAVAIDLAQGADFYTRLNHTTNLLLDPVKKYLDESAYPARIQRVGSMWTLFFTEKEVCCSDDLPHTHDAYKEFYCAMLQKGVYLPPAQNEAAFVSSVHTEEHCSYAANCMVEYFREKACK